MIRWTVLALGLMPCVAVAQGYQIDQYMCEDGGEVTAVYPLGTNDVIITVDGFPSALRQSVSGSGARFTPPQYMPGYVWWIHGDEGMVSIIDSDSGEERTLYQECYWVAGREAFNE